MIQLTTPLVKASTTKKIFNSAWIRRVMIDSPTPTSKVRLTVELNPLNPTSGDIDKTNNITFVVSDINEVAKGNPEVEAAYAAIINAIDIIGKSQGKL